jgi:drug/metabolite transporter (DMT)-like permease
MEIRKGKLKNQNKAYFFAGLTIIFWSTVATAFKFGLKYQDPSQMVSGAVLTALLLFLIFLIVTGKIKDTFRFSVRQYLYSAALGFFNPFFYYLILFKAYSGLPAQVAQPINMIWPLALVILSIPILKQKIGLKSIIALLISFGGVVLISSQGGGTGFSKEQIPGILLCLGSAFVWAIFWLLNVKDRREDIQKLFLNFLFALIYIVIFFLITGTSFPVGEKAWFWAIYAGIFEMGLSFIFWLKALRLSETTDKVSKLIYISPFISLIFIHYLLKEPLYTTTFYGLFLIILGILLQKTKDVRSENEKGK